MERGSSTSSLDSSAKKSKISMIVGVSVASVVVVALLALAVMRVIKMRKGGADRVCYRSGSTGYTWDKTVDACVSPSRSEIQGDAGKAAAAAVKALPSTFPLKGRTISSVVLTDSAKDSTVACGDSTASTPSSCGVFVVTINNGLIGKDSKKVVVKVDAATFKIVK